MSTIGKVLKARSGEVYIRLGQDRDKEGKLVGKNATQLFPITLADGTILNEGDSLFLKSPQREIDELVMKGFITEEVGNSRKNSIPDYVRYKVKLAGTTKTTGK